MRTLLAPAHLALTIVILVWDVFLAGRIAQNRQSTRFFENVCGLGALLLFPALLLTLATSTIITGRAVVTMDWVWPAVLVLFAMQATYAFVRRLVNPVWGLPIMVYDLVVAAIGVVRYLVAHGHEPSEALVALLAGQSIAMVFAGGTSSVLTTPFYLNMPMVSPAFPALRKVTAAFRAVMTAYAAMWVVFIVAIGLPRAIVQLRNYEAHHRDALRERPDADFAVGLKIYPDVANPPPPPAIRADSALLDTMDVDAIAIVVAPGASKAAIDSLAKLLDPNRRDSSTLIIAIGYRGKLVPEFGKSPLNSPLRLETVRQVMTRLHPDILLPAEDPYGSGERAVGSLLPETWESYLSEAAQVAKSINKNVKIGVSASTYNSRDSVLYAWAASPRSPIDIVGFSLFPSPYVGGGIQADTRTADRWLRASPPRKEHWVFATGGYPLAYGERSQQNAVWEVLAWATDHPFIKGLIVYEAGDYGQTRGLRAPNGRLRPVAGAVMRAIGQLRESAR
ncbi:MAG TPA: hypothetical protein VGM50_17300 [Gemmatimonadaceae bacterium]